MKSPMYLLVVFFSGFSILVSGQDIKNQKLNSFSAAFELSTQLDFNLDNAFYVYNPKKYSLLSIQSWENQNVYSNQLNQKLFSNIKIIENTYKGSSDFFRLCSPLDNGIATNINSGDRILSMVLNNFINNILFKGRGLITRLLSSED